MSRRVLLTGGTGFVGANLTRRLLAEGHELHLLVQPGHRAWRLDEIRSDLRIHETALGDESGVAAVVEGVRPEWVFHLAVYGAYSEQADLRRMIETNVVGTINLVQACLRRGFEAFVNTGSSSEYGFKDHPPSETTWLEPNSHYAVTKASATLFCRHTAQASGLHLPTLRLYSVYGPYEEPTRLMPTLVRDGLAGRLPPLVNPDVSRDFVYVDDVVQAYLLAAARHGQERGAIYNVGTGVQTTLRDLVALARRVLGVEAEPVWGSMPDRHWDTTIWVADSRRVRRELGWEPAYTVEAGFRRLVDWVRNDPRRALAYDAARS